jgi:hypothetical protein
MSALFKNDTCLCFYLLCVYPTNKTLVLLQFYFKTFYYMEPFLDNHPLINFWSDAVRDENSEHWYWKSSGKNLTDDQFHWGWHQPSMVNRPRSCIVLGFPDGYLDIQCEGNIDHIICEFSKNI